MPASPVRRKQLAGIRTAQLSLALATGAALAVLPRSGFDHPWLQVGVPVLIVLLTVLCALATVRFIRRDNIETPDHPGARTTSNPETSETSLSAGHGQVAVMEQICDHLSPRTAHEATISQSRTRIREILSHNLLLTAFQPICHLASGKMVGAEALTRFVIEEDAGPDFWFPEAARVGLSSHLELAALDSALDAARHLPPHVYVGLNLSPDTCLDPALPSLLERSTLPLNRIVLELTEQAPVDDYDALITALAPLRSRGVRIAVDDAGSGFASMRHILHLHPDIIKLDRTLITGINHDTPKQALGEALVRFASRTEAIVIAEGIETQAELEALTSLGMTAGQGYLLGHPTVQPADWAHWHPHPSKSAQEIPGAPSTASSLTYALTSSQKDRNNVLRLGRSAL